VAVDWVKYVKRYCWDADKTPYFVPVSQLKRDQANKELFLYSFVVGVPSSVYLVASMVHVVRNHQMGSLAITVYMTSLLVCAIVLYVWKSPGAAMYSITAPVAMALYFLIEGFPEREHQTDFVVMIVAAIAVIVGWLLYSRRLLAVVNAYPGLPVRDLNPWNKLPPGAKPPRGKHSPPL
jgi:hypothetical protein